MHGGGRYPVVFLDVLCILLCKVHSDVTRVCPPETLRRGPNRFGTCGPAIPEILQTICGDDGYNDRPSNNMKRPKRSEDDYEMIPADETKNFLMDKREAFSYFQKRSDYLHRGIVCECCYHQCRMSELTQYCRGDTRKRNYRYTKLMHD